MQGLDTSSGLIVERSAADLFFSRSVAATAVRSIHPCHVKICDVNAIEEVDSDWSVSAGKLVSQLPAACTGPRVGYDERMRRCVAGLALLAWAFGISGCGTSNGARGEAGADSGAGTGAAPGTDAGGGATDSGIGGSVSASADSGSGGDASDGGLASGDAGGVVATGRPFPDTTSSIAVLADQLPSMNAAQTQFAATHYVGTEKQLLPVTQALRAINPNFLVLHYHLSMWQSAPAVDFLVPDVIDGGVDGVTWGNDYPTVTMNESWFWHNASNVRVASSADGKLLMNVSAAGFQTYWAESLIEQVKAGAYDAVFFDSASPALLQGECGTADPRLAGTAARDTSFTALGNATWISAWESWMGALNTTLAAQGIPLIPNTSAFVTGWDNTNYGLTAGIFAEGYAGTSFAVSDWQASTNELLALSAAEKIMILQNYLSASTDLATRLYYLGNYLLVKGKHTYLDYFAAGPMEWYPEWGIDLGAATAPVPASVSAFLTNGVYRRDFANGSVFVNPSSSPVTVSLAGTFRHVVPSGGGAVDTAGTATGVLTMTNVTSLTIGAATAEIVLH